MLHISLRAWLLGSAALLSLGGAAEPAGAASTTERASVGPGGIQGNGASSIAALSAKGGFVAFESDATNLVPGDTNGLRDIFIRGRQAGVTRRVSFATGGAQPNDDCFEPAISADGRFVAFSSYANNLVPGDTNFQSDVFVRDRQASTTQRVSVGPGGTQGRGVSLSSVISADGRYVAFISFASNLVAGDTNGRRDVFVRDRAAGTTLRVNVGPGGAQANADTDFPAISADGRFAAFTSEASTLVPGDTNGVPDVFVRATAP